MRVLLLLLLVVYLAMPVDAQTVLTGEVEYNSDSARQELLATPQKQIYPNLLSIRLKDEDYYENITTLLKGNIEL